MKKRFKVISFIFVLSVLLCLIYCNANVHSFGQNREKTRPMLSVIKQVNKADSSYLQKVNLETITEMNTQSPLNATLGAGVEGEDYQTKINKAIQAVLYAYYMRGPLIQYNTLKAYYSSFSPEEATSQNTNYMICSALPYNVYNELFGIKIAAYYNEKLIDYSRAHINDHTKHPAVIGYGAKNDSGFIEMTLYDDTETKITMKAGDENHPLSIDNIIPYLKIR